LSIDPAKWGGSLKRASYRYLVPTHHQLTIATPPNPPNSHFLIGKISPKIEIQNLKIEVILEVVNHQMGGEKKI